MPDSESASAVVEPHGAVVGEEGSTASPNVPDTSPTAVNTQDKAPNVASDTSNDPAQPVASELSNTTTATTQPNPTSEITVTPDSMATPAPDVQQTPATNSSLDVNSQCSDNSASQSVDQSKPSEKDQCKPAESLNVKGADSSEQSTQDSNPPGGASVSTSEFNLKVDMSNAKPEASTSSGSDTKPKTVTAAMVSDAIAMAKATAEGAKGGSDKAPTQSVYHVKWIKFKGNLCPIVTQNENGPCPLLAIMNILLLQGKVKLPGMIEMVTSEQLMEYLADCIFENAPKNITEDAQLNYEQNMHDAMAVFHKLQTGLDVNVKFTGVSDFEYTPECIVFDLLAIHLYHGWLVDPESPNEVTALGQCSYNQLVEKIILNKNSDKEEIVTEALIAEDFINRTASQLTYHGLLELVTTIKEAELCCFFRNNHFSTVLKNKDELFLLVTDQGFLTESNVVWETLSNVEGDGHFVDGEFHTFRKPEPSTHPIPVPNVTIGSDQQIDQDYLVALSIQQEQAMAEQGSAAGAPPPAVTQEWTPPATAQHLSDHELALRLQEEENRRAQQAAPPEQQRAPAANNGSSANNGNKDRKKSGDCVIL